MKTKDYYVILGVAPTESPCGIREAVVFYFWNAWAHTERPNS